jgi:gentisate 1,2-dioxygenase
LKFEEALPHNSPVLLLYDYESTKSVLQGVKELEKTDKWFGFHYLVFNNRNDAISYVEDGLKKE